MLEFIFFLLTILTYSSYNSVDYGYLNEEDYDSGYYEYHEATDWLEDCDTGSIMELADVDWAKENAPYFQVSSPEELASCVYYVNQLADPYDSVYIELKNDIDLDKYDWVPMGWLGVNSNSFNGEVNGNGYTIYNMHMPVSYSNHTGFIAYSTGSYVHDISFVDATISAASYAGIVGGEIYCSDVWENIYVSGIIFDPGLECGSIIGREAHLTFKNCSSDVLVDHNGERYSLDYFSHRLEVLDNTPVSEDFTLTLNADGSITRNELKNESDYVNLCWHVESGGVEVLQRGASGELVLDAGYVGDKVYLEAFTGETYTRVSNIIEK